MLQFFKTKAGRICLIAVGVILLASIGLRLWLGMQPKFRDLTIELGSPLPPVSEFLTSYGSEKRAQLVTPADAIDLTKTGSQELTFRQGAREQTVKLTIVDTTAPQAVLKEVNASLTDTLLPEQFIESILDYSEVTVEFTQVPVAPDHYGESPVELLLTDASGNTTYLQTSVFYFWIRNSFTMELGQTLTKADLLLDPQKDADLINQAQIDMINRGGAGKYTVTSTCDGITRKCTVIVQDTVAPTLELKDVTIYWDGTADVNSFILNATDNSRDVKLNLLTELPLGTVGTYTIQVEAADPSGNVSRAEATLKIIMDTAAPGFYNVSSITTEKNQAPDYRKGVYAFDDRDGVVTFTYDDSNVDLTKAGTYYAVYTATDACGNTSTYRRKVTVNHDLTDTAALVSSIAASLPDDPREIRDYVRQYIAYNSYWGGDDPEEIKSYVRDGVAYEDWNGNDPIWYGFTTKTGNCLVHALCLQAVLTEKGYTTQIIWVTNESHYWLLIETEDGWRHIDATPGTTHTKYYELMTDEMRKETLSGRDWDRSQWPVCE